MYQNIVKRTLDFLCALIGFIILLPIFIVLLIALLFANSGNPFFIQKRPGKNSQIFSIVKFKTMNDKKGTDGKLLPDKERMTKVGSFIRKTSLDEIPQLLNVIKGDMSLIGPRPLLPEYLPLYSEFQSRRHEMRPGISGWAQVNGRNAISWEQKFEYDIWYVDNVNFSLDCKILFMTIRNVVKREGIRQEGEATTTPFKNTKINN